MNRRRVIIGAVVTALVIAFLWFVVHRSPFLTGLIELQFPHLIPASRLACNLDSSDSDRVRESLAFLTDRADPIAAPPAIELLKSPDDYIWLNAALYLGACNRPEATPYLIKSLRHTAWRADEEAAVYLRAITEQDFGTDFDAWHDWWVAQNPGSTFDWESSLGFNPRIAATKDR